MNVQRMIRVACPLDEAFAVFTDRIDEWWPLRRGFSYGRIDASPSTSKLGSVAGSSSGSSTVTSSKSAP